MNHWIDALSHFHHFLWFLSHAQYKNNSGGEQLSLPPSFPPLTWWRGYYRHSLNCFLVSELTWFSSFRSMFGCVCFFEQPLTFLGLWRRRTSWVLHKNSFGYPKKTIEKKKKKKSLHASKNTARTDRIRIEYDLIIKVRNVSEMYSKSWCSCHSWSYFRLWTFKSKEFLQTFIFLSASFQHVSFMNSNVLRTACSSLLPVSFVIE